MSRHVRAAQSHVCGKARSRSVEMGQGKCESTLVGSGGCGLLAKP